MSVLYQLTQYLDAKAEYYAAADGSDGSYSPALQRLFDRMDDAEVAFDKALDRLIADRIAATKGATP